MKHLLLGLITAMVTTVAPTAFAAKGDDVFFGIKMDELEYRYGDENQRLTVWSGNAFVGTDEYKLVWLTDGEYNHKEKAYEGMTNQLLLQRPISDFFDARVGLRVDSPDGENRRYGVIGITGLAKQWFEVEANLYVSEKGDASINLEAEYELLITNRWILTPSIAADFAFSKDEDMGVGQGLNHVEFGARLSYDVFDREVSPYVGVVYEQTFNETADWAKDSGEETAAWFVVVGTRLMF